MINPNRPDSSTTPEDNRRAVVVGGHPLVAGVPVRDGDIEPTTGLHSVAILFRVLAALLGVIIILQVLNGVTSTVDISYGVLLAEVIRLVIFAGLLWGAGDLADLFVKSHCDLRATRILIGRIEYQIAQRTAADDPRTGDPESGRGHGDAPH
jgi:hypothetical protein